MVQCDPRGVDVLLAILQVAVSPLFRWYNVIPVE